MIRRRSNTPVLATRNTQLETWDKELKTGWHGVSASNWGILWLPLRLKEELAMLSSIAKSNPAFAAVVDRERRNSVDRLIRFQRHLPWTISGKKPFITETGITSDVKEREHAIPVGQLRNYVLIAFNKDDLEEAERRLQFSWLLPTILVSKTTHTEINKGDYSLCNDFCRPYSRYGIRKITRFDNKTLPANEYTWDDILKDLNLFEALRPVLAKLEKLHFPDEKELEETKRQIPRHRLFANADLQQLSK